MVKRLMPSPKYYFLIIILLAIFFSFWKLGSNDLIEWDEAEYGTISFEMMHNGDYINYYYAGTPDTRNAKPPLMIWSIILCYKIFGYTAFALRFTSAIASIIFFFFSFKLINLYRGKLFAFIACLVLLSCKVIVGFHVGRTGDTDALLVCLLTASVYFFLLFQDFGKRYAVFIFAILLGMAFYTKGPAGFVLIPGMFLYSFITGKWKNVIRDYRLWLAILIVLLIAGSWVLILLKKGNEFNSGNSWYGSHNAIETLFSHDTIARLTDSEFEPDRNPDRTFFFSVLDIRFNIWNYFFYLSLLLVIAKFIHDKKWAMMTLKASGSQLALLSACTILPLSIILTMAATKHEWYLAPLALFISVIITEGIIYCNNKYKWFNYVWIGVLIFNLSRQFIYVNFAKKDMQDFFLKNKSYFEHAPVVELFQMPTQDFYLYLNWHANKIEVPGNKSIQYPSSNLIIFDSRVSKVEDFPSSKLIDCNKKYCLASMLK
ncbi:MAG: glycosyltransferase family 39 protein [Bacteroidota bacterium]